MRLKYQKFWKLRYILITAVILFLIANRGFWGLVTNYFELRNLKKQKFHLKQETSKLEEKLKQAKNPDYIEAVARTEIVMIKPNERVYIFPPSENEIDTDIDTGKGK